MSDINTARNVRRFTMKNYPFALDESPDGGWCCYADVAELISELTRLRTEKAALRAECVAWRTAADNYTGDVRVVLSQWPHIEAIASARQLSDSTPGAMEEA